jgi:hypothetical protein
MGKKPNDFSIVYIIYLIRQCKDNIPVKIVYIGYRGRVNGKYDGLFPFPYENIKRGLG